MFFAGPLHLKSSVLLEKKQFLEPVLVFEQRTKQRQLKFSGKSRIRVDIPLVWSEIDTLFLPFFEDIQIGVSISRLDISTY